ncbi:Glycoside hydrolase family 3 protein [Mycena indigotica]|uniref:xylan 1,4-beta-xylosidase n=1 Tax=Mycena indigotica TaxID=2126181 RepID=A0A8H6TEY4_9AGAR|nr:Glycoside hydrolase family 3 protein [Mycena indigotica]KAF7315476.1 Glycoside hydrolase family 3 protein [Mycena indigotica]
MNGFSSGVGFEYRRSDRAEGFNWHFVEMPYGCIRFHRAHFLDVFVKNLPESVAHFGKRLASYNQVRDGIQLEFSDGTSAICDLLVGCDGIKSTVRKQMLNSTGRIELEEHIEPRWSGSIAYRGLIPVAKLPEGQHRALQYPVMYCGKDKHVVVYSISKGTVVNVVAFASDSDKENTCYGDEWVTSCSKEEMQECFAGWEPEVSVLLDRIESPTKWGIHHLAPLPLYVTGRVALLGDAAHAMTPHLGSGAGQAIEDAYILAKVLGAATLNTLDAALEAYETTRLPMANHVLRASAVAGKMFEFNNELGERYQVLGPAIGAQWNYLDETTPEGESMRAVERMREALNKRKLSDSSTLSSRNGLLRNGHERRALLAIMLLLASLAAVFTVGHAIDVVPNVTVSGPTRPPTLTPFAYAFPNCKSGPLKDNAVCDRSKDPVTRAEALIQLWTVPELIANSVHQAPGVSRLGIPPYQWWSEASHGISWTGPGVIFAPDGDFSYATSFPSPINLGASFDDPLVFQVGTVISTEGRAFNSAQRAGLDYFAPNINPWRDPRWGRGQETPGESALHSANYVYQLVNGFQGGIDPSPYIKVIATCKHYAAYDLDQVGDVIQRNFSAEVTTQEFAEYYLPPFQTCVRDAKVKSVMCAYNAVNGVPACSDPYILQTVLRDYYGFPDDGYVVSDCDAVQSIYENHKFVNSYQAAAAVALNAGTDLNCGSIYGLFLQQALDQNLTATANIQKALVRQYASLVRLGYFDPPELQPYRQFTFADVGTPAAEKMAYDVAVEGMVLLKNDGTLPLKKSLKKMALIGPWAQATEQMQGNYYGTAPFLISPQMGAVTAGFNVTFVEGTGIQDGDTSSFSDALEAAAQADVIVFAGGIDNDVEAEGLDRTDISWPGAQLQLIQKLASVGKPFVVVQFGAGQVDDSWLLKSKDVNAILWAGYPGQSGGTAVADVLTGKVAPAGRLPLMQYPADYVNQVSMLDMNLRPNKTSGNPGRTYQWYTGKPVIDYGFGLHYTTFSLQWQGLPALAYDIQALVAKAHSAAHLDLGSFDTFGVTVRNIGHVTSDFVSLLFVKTTAGPAPHPNKVLIGYSRVHSVNPGAAAIARIGVKLGDIARVDHNGNAWVYPGLYTLSLDVPERLTHSFVLVGHAAQLSDFPAPPASWTVGADKQKHSASKPAAIWDEHTHDEQQVLRELR